MTDGFDLQSMLEQAQQLQQQMFDAQEEAAGETVEGQAGGGAVRITATGAGEVVSVAIDPTVVDPADVPLLEDLVLAALHDTMTRVAELSAQRMGALGLGLLSGLGSGSDGGLGGGLDPGLGGGPGTPESPHDGSRVIDVPGDGD